MGYSGILGIKGVLRQDIPESPSERSLEKKRVRKHQIMEILRGAGELSRVEIARRLGYNLPTVSALVDELLTDALIGESSARKTRQGRRPVPLQLNMNAWLVIGIVIEEEATRLRLFNLCGITMLDSSLPTGSCLSGKQRWLLDRIKKMLHEAESSAPILAGVGLVMPDCWTGDQQQSFAVELEELLGCSVVIEKHVRARAMATLWLDNPHGTRDMLYFDIGSHTSLALIQQGRLVRGKRGLVGTLALHNGAISPGTQLLEELARRQGLRIGKGRLSAEGLLAQALTNGGVYQEVTDNFLEALAAFLAPLILLMDPEEVVVGGHLAPSLSDHLVGIQTQLAGHLGQRGISSIPVRTSTPDPDSTLHGAGAMVLHGIFSPANIPVEAIL